MKIFPSITLALNLLLQMIIVHASSAIPPEERCVGGEAYRSGKPPLEFAKLYAEKNRANTVWIKNLNEPKKKKKK